MTLFHCNQPWIPNHSFTCNRDTTIMASEDNRRNNTEPDGLSYGKVIYIHSRDEYYEALDAAGDRLVVVDCYAEWCPPCQQISPLVDALALEYPEVRFLKVDVEKVPTIKSDLGIWAMPTFVFLKDGNKVGAFMGAKEDLLRKGVANGGNVGACASFCAIQ